METQPDMSNLSVDNPGQIVAVIVETHEQQMSKLYALFEGFQEYADTDEDDPRFI